MPLLAWRAPAHHGLPMISCLHPLPAFSPPFSWATLVRHLAPALLCSALSVGALAQQPSTNASTLPVLQHRVRNGDTLEQLAQRYLGDARLWQQLQTYNQGIDPLRLPPGQVLDIPLSLLRSASARVDYLQGRATLTRRGSATQGVERGQQLQEGDRLQLEPDAFVSVRLADGSTVRVQASSDVTLRQLRRRGRAGSLQSVIELQQGGVEVDVPGQRDTTRALEVLTPVAATSVRGTRFDVQASAQGSATAVERGQVALQARAPDLSQTTPPPSPARTALDAGYGMAIQANGQVGRPTALLAAPASTDLPQHSDDAQWLDLPLPAIAGAQAYRVHILADQDGAQVLRNAQFDRPHARFVAVPDGQYWLQVRGVDAQGIGGHKAQVPLRVKAHPVAPLPQSPAPNAVGSAGATTLRCTPVQEAQAYVLEIAPLGETQSAAQADFTHPALRAQDRSNCQLDVASLSPGRYAWRTASVRWVQGVRDQGPYLPAQALTLATPPSAPSATDLHTSTQLGISTLHWPGAPGQRYRLQVLAQASDAQPTRDLWLEAPQWTAQDLPAGRWLVRIQVQDANGLLSAFSPLRAIQVLPLLRDGSGQTVGTDAGLGLEYQ